MLGVMPNPPGRLRRSLSAPALILIAALVNAVLYHAPLFAFALGSLDTASARGLLTLLTLAVLVVAATALVFGALALASERLVKPLLMIAAVGNSIALYFVLAYGVVLDKAMMGNVLATTPSEAGELFHPRLLAYLLVLGALPCWLLSRVTLGATPRLRRLAFVGIVLAVTLGWAYANAPSWLWLDQNARRLGGMTLPWSYVVNGSRRLLDLAAPREQKLLPPAHFAASGPSVVMLLIGEAARAQDFSLYGYPRPTNPRLATLGVAALPHARSCSTYTTASLVCLLSHLDSGRAGSWEPLPSYLQRNGVDVIWRTNNWGEPRMAVQTFERARELRAQCRGDGCNYDEVLLQGLAERIRASARERVFVVLHLGGSHGPAYHDKYPARFETFKPVCTSVELQRCTREALVNAYDNTIVYADHVIAEAIALLQGLGPIPTALMYVSDHGESLGEYGLYLHGTPYSIAPDVQKDIPFIVWTSAAFRERKSLRVPEQVSQAWVFHSVMGALDLRSDVYRPELDLFSR
jgi:lipid A ethanolaminephosphotransferase